MLKICGAAIACHEEPSPRLSSPEHILPGPLPCLAVPSAAPPHLATTAPGPRSQSRESEGKGGERAGVGLSWGSPASISPFLSLSLLRDGLKGFHTCLGWLQVCDRSPALPGCQRGWEICDTASLLITSLSAFSSLPALLRPATTTSIVPACQAAWLHIQRRNADREEASQGLAARGRVTCVPRCAHGATFKPHNGMEYRPSHTCRKTHSPSRVYAGNTKHVFQQRTT